MSSLFSTENIVFVLMSFEGPDKYSLVGGLGTRIMELARVISEENYKVHTFFVGDPYLPENTTIGNITYHRKCKNISSESSGIYDREAEKIGLKNVKAIHGRAEDLARKPEYREQFDLCVSRAVANLSTLSEYCIPFIHRDGIFIPYKSGTIEEEIQNSEKALRILKGKIEKVCSYSLPENAGERTFIIIRKEGETPKKFPRKAGLPSKEPIT